MNRDNFYLWLKEEVGLWLKEGIVTNEQAQKILAKSKVTISAKEEEARGGKIISYITGLGAILIGVGVIAFFASNWEELPRISKLIAIYAALFASYYFGFSLSFVKRTYPLVGMSLLVLGSILFGSAIFLLAQIYNIHAHYPNGLLLWGACILPLAYILSSRAILTISIGVLSVWLGTELSFWVEDYHYRAEDTYFFALYGVWCVFLYSLGTLHTKFESLKYHAGVYRYLSISGILTISYILGFRYMYLGTLEYDLWDMPKIVLAFLVIASIVNIVIGLKYKKPESKAFTYEVEGLGLFLLILLISSFMLESKGGYYYEGYSYHRNENIIYPVLYNFVLFSASVGTVLLGYSNKNISYVNMGTFFVGMQIITRYVEWSWDLMDRSLFFLVGGILFLAIGYLLEKQRRKMVGQIRVA